MGSGNFYSRMANSNENLKRNRLFRSVFLAGILMFCVQFKSNAQVFLGGSNQTITVCQNSTVYIDTTLEVNDTSTIYPTDTFGVVSSPVSGILTGFPVWFPSGGIVLAPPGTLYYTPNPGFTGNDIFVVYVNNGSGPVYDTITVVVNPLPSLSLIDSAVTVCAGTSSVTFAFTGLTGVGPISTVVSAVGNTGWVVPAGVTGITFDIQGASGSGDNYSGAPNPGNGSRVQGYFAVTPGEALSINVGGQGGLATTLGATGGWNGGGNAYYYPLLGATGGTGGAGGGASDIRVGGNSLTNRVIVAGGGGGNGWDSPYGAYYGGAGGGLIGGSSQPNVEGSSAGGGTQVNGGAAATRTGWVSGTNGSLGQGGNGSALGGVAGGGGGGYYGGGGGVWNGGGGGSDFTDPTQTSLVTHTPGYRTGDGIVKLTYNVAGTYTISNWSGGAYSAGFADVTASLPSSPITVSVPSAAPAGTYTAILTISNGTCGSVSYPISITINPIPNITDVLTNQTVCNGLSTTGVTFTGSVAGTVFNWSVDNTSFGLPAADTGSFPAITAANATANPEVANISVTPMAAGCTGATSNFSITAYPTPVLSNQLVDSVCSGLAYSYTPMSATAGTRFVVNRNTAFGLTPVSYSDTVVNETLTNTTSSRVSALYSVALSANGCVDTQSFVLIVKPTPVLNSTTANTPVGVCGSVPVSFVPSSMVAGTTYTWSRNVVTDITNPAETGTGSVNDTLNNDYSATATVVYDYSLNAYGCTNNQEVTAVIFPTPRLTSSTTNTPVCSGSIFNYNAVGTPTGAVTYSWTRNEIPGIGNALASGSGNVNESLMDTTASGIMVTYDYTVMANGCTSVVYPVTVWVNPKPMLTSGLTPAGVCDNVPFVYNPTSTVSGTTYNWLRLPVDGIVYGSSTSEELGINGVNETLTNTTGNPLAVTYYYVLGAYGGCTDTQAVTVMINPIPTFTGNTAPVAQCDSVVFKYTPSSSEAGATYNWTRNYVEGILAATTSGTGNVNEELINTTNVNVNATYQYTTTANGCTSNPADVVVTVRPTARLSSVTTGTVCTDVPFNYSPTSYTPNTTFKWNRLANAGINGGLTGNGIGSISNVLDNTTSTPIVVTYEYQMTAYGCTNPTSAVLHVTVNSGPAGAQIMGNYTSSVCSGTNNQTYGAVNAPGSGVNYTWDATNATIWSTTNNGQYILVDFPNSGDATLTLNATYASTGCSESASINVTVGSSANLNPEVIYYQGMFVCLNNEEVSYQWGYDDATTFQSTAVPGAVNQSYTDPSADFTNYNYWVITTYNGCTQKTYYNPPKSTVPLRTSNPSLSVYPNPVLNALNLVFSNSGSANMEYEIVNMLGQKILTGTAPEAAATIDASSLTPGCYLINCYHEGVKIATTRFVKN